MSLEKRQEIASRGGRATQESDRGHRFRADDEATKDAARKGGEATSRANQRRKARR